MTDLKELRGKIDDIDRKIVELFQERMEIVSGVAKYKKEKGLPVLNSIREGELIEKNINYLKNKELTPYLKEFYIKLMDLSKDYQRLQIDKAKEGINVCFQGTTGSYSQEALFEYFGSDATSYPVKEFEDVFKKLKDDNISYGVLPIENSSTGAINEVYDLLRKYGLYIVGNMTLKINHNLMAIEGAKLEDIKTVYSHPQAFKQCSEFLKDKGLELIGYHNTAVSAELVSEKKDKTMAAIGSKKAAEVNNLKIIKNNINNDDSNYTRFIIIGKTLETSDINDAISIVFSSPNKVGALYDSLGIFKKNNLNMIRIESRPVVGKPWEYFFYIDFEGDINNEHVKEAIDYIQNNSSYFKFLGNYKK
ncbi:prephenate dehydratase [Tissierella creatinophila]|uniref:Bifunctional chorismate mutase/prephenate dehydratase n=1 Tax=Tissierella creatinophila DSM 6911 TaxID=1123403 RepID=A0A1U7M556_TISCR|nr:prephenate dehydratase [Tissierella creatinophila]OLS02349.1 P-protein [Tissierella creatinophila DSM 6911]